MSSILGDNINDYEELHYFDKIIFNEIYKAYNIKLEKDVTLKVIKKERYKDQEILKKKLNNEIELLKLCKNERILDFYNFFETEDNYIIEQESYDINLFEYIKNNGGLNDDKDFFKTVVLEVSKALQFIHEKGVMHRCIRTNHIFLINKKDDSSSCNGDKIKLGGFNFAILIKDNVSEPLDSIFYTAPEIINGEKYDEKCDLWSLGVTLYQLYFGIFPFGSRPSKNIVIKCISDEENFHLEKTEIPILDNIFEGLLQINPRKRITFEKFFKIIFNYNFIDEYEKLKEEDVINLNQDIDINNKNEKLMEDSSYNSNQDIERNNNNENDNIKMYELHKESVENKESQTPKEEINNCESEVKKDLNPNNFNKENQQQNKKKENDIIYEKENFFPKCCYDFFNKKKQPQKKEERNDVECTVEAEEQYCLCGKDNCIII